MAFGPIMRFPVEKVDGLTIELAPLTREVIGEFVSLDHGGGMQRYSVTRYLGRRLAPVLEDEHDWYEKTRLSKTDIVWGIWVKEGEGRTLIGSSGLHGVGEDSHAGFIRLATSGSMIFRPNYWGKGIASAAHKARISYAFQQLGLHCVKSAVIQANIGSYKALTRSGYVHTHTGRNEHFVDGCLQHIDYLECLNPSNLFWHQWWHGDRPPVKYLQARQLTLEALAWAEENVTLV